MSALRRAREKERLALIYRVSARLIFHNFYFRGLTRGVYNNAVDANETETGVKSVSVLSGRPFVPCNGST